MEILRGERGRHHYKLLFFNCLVFGVLGFFIPRLSLGTKSKNLILLRLLVFLVFELPGAAGDKSRAPELQKHKKQNKTKNIIKHPHSYLLKNNKNNGFLWFEEIVLP